MVDFNYSLKLRLFDGQTANTLIFMISNVNNSIFIDTNSERFVK